MGQPILIDQHARVGLSERLRVESHGPIQFKTLRQPVAAYSVPGQRV